MATSAEYQHALSFAFNQLARRHPHEFEFFKLVATFRRRHGRVVRTETDLLDALTRPDPFYIVPAGDRS